jgi:hypothetical protein
MSTLMFTLIPRDPEIAFRGTLAPCARDLPVIGTYIIQFAFRTDVNRTAGRILRIGFDANCPVCYIQKDTGERNGIRTRIDYACDILAIPIHDERHMVPLSAAGSPVTGPRTCQWMALLRQAVPANRQNGRYAKHMKNVSAHRYSIFHRLGTISLITA